MYSAFFLFALVGSTLAAQYPIADNSNCKHNQKFIDKVGSPFIRICKEANILGETIRQSQIVACLAYDDVTEIPLGSTWDHYISSSKLAGYRIGCKKTANGGFSVGPESCIMGQPSKVVPFGQKGVVGHQICTCLNGAEYNIKCEAIDLFSK